MIRTSPRVRARHDRSSRVSFQPRVDPFRFEANRSSAADARVVQLTSLARGVDRVATHTGVLGALTHGEPGLHTALPRKSARSRTKRRVVMGVYAPRRAGDVAGAVLVMGADAGPDASIGPRGRLVHAVWATISAIGLRPRRRPDDGRGARLDGVRAGHGRARSKRRHARSRSTALDGRAP